MDKVQLETSKSDDCFGANMLVGRATAEWLLFLEQCQEFHTCYANLKFLDISPRVYFILHQTPLCLFYSALNPLVFYFTQHKTPLKLG